MKQIFQSLNDGTISCLEVPVSQPPPGHLQIQSKCSLLSAGTERMLLEFGKANLLNKAKQQPDKVRDVINKIKADGVLSTLESVKSKLNEPLSLGYCNSGVVVGVGDGVKNFKVGDRVASNGLHAELVIVPENLCARIPDNVNTETAAFTVLAAIGLQGIRLAQPTLGETFVISGLGLIGLLTAQLLIMHGCKVIGMDPSLRQCDIARKLGVRVFQLTPESDPVTWCKNQTEDIGVDGVLITASTSSNEPIELASEFCRQRGRIVLVGVTGLELRRELFYKKELSFQVSCSYGPGRYDDNYEQRGNDYPIGFVRWTEQRNFEAVLHGMSTGAIATEGLISHRFPIEQASEAYELLSSPEPSLGIILNYANNVEKNVQTINLNVSNKALKTTNGIEPRYGFIGAGNYASRTLIPAFANTGGSFISIGALNGARPIHIGNKFKFQRVTTDIESLLNDDECNTIVIATRHDSHGSLVNQALRAGKHIFVEKPLCINSKELKLIKEIHDGRHVLMVGFNRRFAPLLVKMKEILNDIEGPKAFIYTCNAGAIPSDHWTQDPLIGGGRMIGEACHFVDLLRHLVGAPISDIKITSAVDNKKCADTLSVQLLFTNGSIGTVHYFSNGHKAFPKERLEVFANGKTMRLDNFRKLEAWGIPNFRAIRQLKQDKGQLSCCAAFVDAIRNGLKSPIPIDEIFEVHDFILKALET